MNKIHKTNERQEQQLKMMKNIAFFQQPGKNTVFDQKTQKWHKIVKNGKKNKNHEKKVRFFKNDEKKTFCSPEAPTMSLSL